MTAGEAEFRLRTFLDDWKFWMGVAYVAIVGMIVALFFLNRDVAREQAARTATQKAAAVSSRDNCYQMVDSNPDLVAIIDAIALTARNNVLASRAALAVSPDGPLAHVRRGSIQRNQQALVAARKFKRQIQNVTPTEERCDALALRLGLEPLSKEGK